MNKICAIALCCCMLLTLAACGEEAAPTTGAAATQPFTTESTVSTTTATQTTEPASTAVYTGALACVAMPVITEAETAENGTTLFRYSYPDVAVTLPDADVAQVVNLDLLNKIDATAQAAQQIHSTAKADYSGQTDWYSYFLDVSYHVERLDQNVLSLYGTEASFDGSPGSATVGISANYDLSTGTSLTLQSIMYADFSADVLCQLIVDGLAGYAEGLFPGYEDVIDQMFSTNVPVESWYFSNKGLCFYFAPYEIAPNAMGVLVSEIPYAKLSGLMKEAYFPTDELLYAGTLELEPVSDPSNASLDHYSQFGELILGGGGQKYLLTAKGSVLNLRIYTLREDSEAQASAAGDMVYASAGMGPADAVLLDLPAGLSGLYFEFESNGETVTLAVSDITAE